MKVALLARIIVPNVVILAMIWAVLQDRAGRLAYFRTLGFTPSTHYYPFFYITSAVDGTTHIAGQLTLDWVQVLVVALLILDLVSLLPLLTRHTAERQTAGSASAVT